MTAELWNGASIEQVTDNDRDDTGPSLCGYMIAYASWFDTTPQIMLARIPEPVNMTIVGFGVAALLAWRRRQ